VTKLLTQVHLLREVEARSSAHRGVVQRSVLPPDPEQGQAAVARDREQPRAQRVGRVPARERAKGGREGVLRRVLGLLDRAEEVPAEREDGAMVAVVDRLEDALAAGLGQPREACVGRRLQEPGRQLEAGRGTAGDERGG